MEDIGLLYLNRIQVQNSCQGLIFNRSPWLRYHNTFKLKPVPPAPAETTFKCVRTLGAGRSRVTDVQGSESTGLSYSLFYLILLPSWHTISQRTTIILLSDKDTYSGLWGLWDLILNNTASFCTFCLTELLEIWTAHSWISITYQTEDMCVALI